MKWTNCMISLLVLLLMPGFLVEDTVAAPFVWRHPDGQVWLDDIVPGHSIRGDVNGLSNPQQYRALLYLCTQDGWRRYPFGNTDPAVYSVPIRNEGGMGDSHEGGWGEWEMSLDDGSWSDATLAVLIVTPKVAKEAPEHVETLKDIPHLARAVHANVVHGEEVLYPPTKKQSAANWIFYYFDPSVAKLFQALQDTRVPKGKALVYILEDVRRPGIYEVDRKFDIHAVLETAGGYGYLEKHELPYVVTIFKNIRGRIDVKAIVYRGPHKQLPHEQPEIFLENGDVIDIPRMLCD